MRSHSRPVLVLTNDDGVDAPGMHALRQAAGGPGPLPRDRPLRADLGLRPPGHDPRAHHDLSPRSATSLAIAGTPVDCVRLAIHSLATDLSWVISGINRGGNLGTDVHISGTVAAVREAAIRGVPGIAVSHYVARGREHRLGPSGPLDRPGCSRR